MRLWTAVRVACRTPVAGAILLVALVTASAARAQVIPSDSLQHYWALDESAGTTAVDSVGGQNGTLVGGPVWQSAGGRFQGALDFDGVDDYVSLGNMDIPTGPGMSVTLWMKADDFGVTDARLISKASGTANANHYWMVSTVNSTALRFRLRAGGSTTTLATTTGQVSAGQWYFVAVTYDGSTMRIYKNGAEVASTAKTGALDTSASIGVAIGNQPAGAGNLPFDGRIDDVRIYNRALSAPEIAAMVPPPGPPQITLWYGDNLDFGQLGVPQRQVNILGSVLDAGRIDSLYYSLNGGADSMLTVGPDGARLIAPGDFNVEIDYDSLLVGSNSVLITAVDTLGQRADTTVTVNYTDGVAWDFPDTLRFTTASTVQDAACVVDGRWNLVAGGVRTDSGALGYDRILTAGEGHDSTSAWTTDYEVLAPITINQYITSPGRGAIGVGMGWQGHSSAGEQPGNGHEYQAIAFIRDVTTSPVLDLYYVTNNGYLDVLRASAPISVSLGVTYLMRMRSVAISADSSRVSAKVWQQGTTEPAAWDVAANFATIPGSVLLISHYADATFGDTIVRPLSGVLTVNTAGGGSVTRSPDLSVYPDSTEVELTAVPNAGWSFTGWSGALTGNANPDTLLMVGDASVTATFAPPVTSDDFHSATLDTTLWHLYDPLGDATLKMTGTNVLVDVPGGQSHDLWSDCNCAPRLLQNVANVDFGVEVKFDSRGAYNYQGQGIIVQEDNDTYLRFDIVYSSGGMSAYAGYINGASASSKLSKNLTQNAPYVRVTRTGNSWNMLTSTNGSSWVSRGTFTQALTVTAVGFSVVNDNSVDVKSPTHVGNVDYFFNTASPIAPEDGGAPSAPTPPVIEVSYGTDQTAALGTPQHRYNIVGRVWESDAVDSLSYSLNGGPSHKLNPGPDGLRLLDIGDFNAEIPYDSLVSGANSVVITAVDTTGESSQQAVTLNYTPGVSWSMPDLAAFEGASAITDQAYVVDGDWHLTSAGVRNDSSGVGYDRLLALGDTLWPTEYEVETPFTIHRYISTGGRGAVGLAVGWRGHLGPEQPSEGHPYQAIAFVRDVDSSPVLELYRVVNGGYLDEVQAITPISVSLGVKYRMKVRSTAISADSSRVSAKVWPDGSPEPSSWDLESDFPTVRGSVLLISHYAETTFGNTTVTPLPAFPIHNLAVNVLGGGSVTRSLEPDSVMGLYPDSSVVGLTAVPDSGWVFAGWSGGLSGSASPDTVLLVSDTTITATFLQTVTLASGVVGNGSVVFTPDTTQFLTGDTVIVTALPDPGWEFSGWSGALTGAENPDTLVMTADTTVTATFTTAHYVLARNVVGSGSIALEPDSATFLYGDTVVVTAVPDTNWAFTGWSGGLSGSVNPDTIIVASDTSVTATFAQTAFVVTRNVIGNGSITAEPDSATYALGDTVVVTAVPDTGWAFDAWSGGLTGNANPDTIIVASDTSITGTFLAQHYVVSRSVVGSGSVTVGPDSATFLYGDTVVVTAVPDPHWVFTGWSGGLSGMTNPDTIIVASDTSVTATFTQTEFVLTRNVIGNGSITAEPDSATYGLGDTIVVTAVPDIGWAFDSWSEGLSGNANPDTIIVAGDTSVTATFAALQYTLARNVVGGGSIVAAPDSATYEYGDTVVVTALPDPHWAFSGWSGGLTGATNPDTIVVASDTSVTATFTQTEFVLTRGVVGSGSITAEPDSATYALGDTIVVTAVPDTGWAFDAWSNGLSGNANPDTIIVAGDTSVTATFVALQYTLARNAIGNGSIVAAPDSATYEYGDTVVVTAMPDEGWLFDSWSGGLSGNANPDTIVVAGDTSITATFVQATYTVATSAAGAGAVMKAPDQPVYLYGDTVVVTAVPDPHWAFTGWAGGLSGATNPDTIIVASDTSITAAFAQTEFVLTRNAIGNGSITAEPDSATYALGDTIVVTAVPDAGWTFDSWSEGLSGSANPDTIIVASDTSITATFVQAVYTISTSAAGSGAVTKAPDQPSYLYGDTVVVTAVPDPHWSFTGWSGGLAGTTNPDTIIVASDTSITATFAQTEFVLTRGVVGSGSIAAEPDSATYALGDTIVVTALPDLGWSFDSWSDGLSGTANPDTIIVASDTSITATFIENAYTVTAVAAGSGAVVKTPDQPTYLYGDTVMVTAVPDLYWSFTGWSDGLSGTENPDTIVVAGDTTVTASFEQTLFVLTRNVVGTGSIVSAPDSVAYPLGDTVVVSAVPGPGWVFAGWTGALSGAQNPDTLVIAGTATITATFVKTNYTLARNVTGNGSITASPDQPVYAYGDTVVVTAVPDPDWYFASWSDGLSGSENPDTVIMMTDTTVTANFTQDIYTVSVAVVGGGHVTKMPDQPAYALGDTVLLTAVPDSAFVFDHWSGNLVGEQNPDTVVVAGNVSVTATFLAGPSAIRPPGALARLTLEPNAPNPFQYGTTIRFGLPRGGDVDIEVYDVLGRVVRRVRLPQQSGGWHQYYFDAKGTDGAHLPAGVYFCRVRSLGQVQTRKMVIIR